MPWRCMPFFACNRQIDSLDKRQCNLQTIPHDIERYSRSLEELLLDMNHIKELPKSLFRLHKLRRLGLSDNDIYRLPPDIASLHNLVELNLSRNDISDIPEDLKVCRQLLILDMSSNPIARLPDSITHVISLTHLALNDTSLTKLPQDIGQLSNLKSLEVRENHLRSLVPSIAQLVHLQRFDLGQNELDELPPEIGSLRSLQELYVDENSLESLPEAILRCKALEQLDVSSNRLMRLPEDIGELENLTDLTVSHNCLSALPNSIGKMKRLAILKLDDNNLTSLTPAIGSCIHLIELFLMQNLLTELPSTIGNLQKLQNLNCDKNHLRTIPSLIGSCFSLAVLSMRDNEIEELPLEIGKCEKLRVLDMCNNRLQYLPYTINVLFNLQALWLSENQSQAMLKLTTEQDPRTGMRVLTCYLLPQQSATVHDMNKMPNKSFVGGPKVHFGDMEREHEDESTGLLGNFERHDTPHPKPHTHGPKHKKQLVDGHIIHHEDDKKQPTNIALTKKVSEDRTNDPSHLASTSQGPRSALKHPPVLNVYTPERAAEITTTDTDKNSETKRIRIPRDPNNGLGLSIAGGIESTPFILNDAGIFISKLTPGGAAERAGLKVGDKMLEVNGNSMLDQRHDFAVQCIQKPVDSIELVVLREVSAVKVAPLARAGSLTNGVATPQENLNRSLNSSMASTSTSSSTGKEVISMSITRESSGSTGFGITTTNDGESSIMISSITPKGPADQNGKIQVGDHILSINGTNVRGATLDQALALLTGSHGNEIYLVVQRDTGARVSSPIRRSPASTTLPKTATSPTNGTTSFGSTRPLPYGDKSLDNIVEEVELVRDEKNSLGLSVVGGIDHCSHPFGTENPGVFISKIANNSPAARSSRLRVGDRILSVNGKNVEQSKHNEAVEALKKSGQVLKLRVRHDPQPLGLREVVFRRRSNAPIGLSICGGINSPPANPHDSTDEGIFIERVEKGSAADESARLKPGLRILEVNDDSLLGCTQMEAANLLRNTGSTIRLLICDGFNPELEETARRFSPDPAIYTQKIHPSREETRPLVSKSLSPSGVGLTSTIPSSPLFDDKPLATSSPIPSSQTSFTRNEESLLHNGHNGHSTTTTASSPIATSPISSKFSSTTFSAATSASRLPPPVAPKPKPLSEQNLNSTPTPGTPPENLTFSSKIRRFDTSTQGNTNSTSTTSLGSTVLPSKRPLLSEEDLRKIREDESRRILPQNQATTPEQQNSFEHLLNNSPVPAHSGPSVVRTKKAENRLLAASPSLIPSTLGGEPLNTIEQRALEQQKRQEWRQARLASLEAEAARAEEVMNRVQQINSRLGNISEERAVASSPVNQRPGERILKNETSVENHVDVDPVNGAKTYSVIERSVTQREYDLGKTILSSGDIDFMDGDK
uniref:PDZ domain-containing protein n=1 Tax=Acrobeloides nanus TaxID=290746 RepID=A0A914DC39_9BILA